MSDPEAKKAIAAIHRENQRRRARHAALRELNRRAVAATLVAIDAQIAARVAAREAGYIDHWASRLLKQALERLAKLRWLERDVNEERNGGPHR